MRMSAPLAWFLAATIVALLVALTSPADAGFAAPDENPPVVVTACDPNAGEILEPSIAALDETSALTIVLELSSPAELLCTIPADANAGIVTPPVPAERMSVPLTRSRDVESPARIAAPMPLDALSAPKYRLSRPSPAMTFRLALLAALRIAMTVSDFVPRSSPTVAGFELPDR